MNQQQDIITDWYYKYSDSVQSFIYIMIQDYQQSEDLTHDTFLKAYKNLELFKGNSTEKTWLFSIAHNVTIDYIRKQKPIKIVLDVLSFRVQAPNTSPEFLFELREETYQLYQAINELKHSHKVVIIMRKIKGFSIKETSDILGWSENKVKSTFFRAIRALEKKLKQRGVTHEEVFTK
ncbi:RNA polymerase sigma factor [Bacillus alkalicellulosilyticus]|uniref:RNA polymerase sigma factor n=1 Tax=Alkalihalobacterium alkalicellulosilyticum TaxID=1912214 RepID=UPI001FEBECD3|nr:RNA polymerase sigma factor [Bacillus alkalicellulosilyticus]